jgi:protein involved in polysaccharide export with SLBB domain
LKKLIEQKAEAITGVNVSVSMGRLKSIQVFALGEVNVPGIHTVGALASITNVLYASGGPTELGSLRNIQVKRRGNIIAELDLYDMLLEGNTAGDIRLMSGDAVFVPQVGPLVSVVGNVKREAKYEMKDEMSLRKALQYAGGLSPSAYNQRIQIERFFENRFQIALDISYHELRSEDYIPLEDGDLIRVFSVLSDVENIVKLYGNVKRDGQYAYEPGMRIKDIIPDIESLKKDTYYEYALIKRYRYDNMKSELIPFHPGRLLLENDPAENLELQPKDEIYIFKKELFKEKDYAVVKGMVREPGKYEIDDMRVRDLILHAGDLKPDAYMGKAELIRTDENRRKHTLFFNVKKAMEGAPNHNIKIQNEDIVIIHTIWEDQWEKSVSIEGEIKEPGEYTLTEKMGVKELIFKAGGLTRDAYMEMGHLYRTNWQTKEKTLLKFNLDRAMSGDPRHNLELEDLDKVYINNIWDYKKEYTVTITGSVHRSGDYPYAENMTIRDLIMIAGNIQDSSYMKEGELVRHTLIDGVDVQTNIYPFNVSKALIGDPEHNLKLYPMDHVIVKRIVDIWTEKRSANIWGEVRFPGLYQIQKNEKLSSLIERAGGFTDYSYLRGAVFTRESAKEIQRKRLEELMRRLEIEINRQATQEAEATVDPEDIAAQRQFVESQKALLDKLRSIEATGRVVIDLAPLDVFKGKNSDIVLEDGDELFIPEKPNTVSVLGAVYNPTSLFFDPDNQKVSYYLELTGGPTTSAETDLIHIVRANGTVISRASHSSWWSDFGDTKLYPGDAVLVPESVARKNIMRDVKDITQILYQIAVAAGVTIALF